MKLADAEIARKLFAQPCDFVLAAVAPLHFPASALTEVAFIGRSNVGKSSLINALTGRKGLARASNTPGRTQQVVFFNLADRMMLVDLPGYGHAKAPVAEKERWNKLVQTYLRKREVLKCVFVLIDGRHGPKANDEEMMSFLDRAAVLYQIVLTKMDKVTTAERAAVEAQTRIVAAKHPAALPDILATSAEDKDGINDLRAYLAAMIEE